MADIDAKRNKLIAKLVKKPGLRGKIDAKCCECIYDPNGGGGGWREQIVSCTSYTCPLYPVRPKSYAETGQEDPVEDHF